jgi:antitoxin component YwqK of YwqJK toxin-antitoxin module
MITDQEIYDWAQDKLHTDQFGPVEKAAKDGDYSTLFQTMLGNWNWCVEHGCPIDKLECEKRANGVGLYWHSNGKIWLRRELKNGELRRREEWRSNGELLWQEEWKGGELRWQTEWKGGKRHGVTEYWHPNGQLWVQEEYKDGKRHGVREVWDKNGQLMAREEWKDGKRLGVTKFWGSDGGHG